MRNHTADSIGVPLRGTFHRCFPLGFRDPETGRESRTELVDRRGAGSCAGPVLAQQEGQHHQPHRHPRKFHIDILVALRLRLPVELGVDLASAMPACRSRRQMCRQRIL